MGRVGRFGTWPSSPSAESAWPSSSVVEPGEREGRAESRAKSSIEAASEGDVMLSPEMSEEVAVAWVSWWLLRRVSSVFSVGRLGVDLLWKPDGTGRGFERRGFGGVPLLCGGMLLLLLRR